MTHVSDSTIKQFRLAFPEMAHYSDMEVTAYCRNMIRIQRIEFIKFLLGRAIQEGKEEYAEWLKSKIYDT